MAHRRLGGAIGSVLDCYDIFSLRTFLALGDGEAHLLAFGQSFEAVANNGTEVGENIRAGLLLNKSKTFCFVEPLNGSSNCIRHGNS